MSGQEPPSRDPRHGSGRRPDEVGGPSRRPLDRPSEAVCVPSERGEPFLVDPIRGRYSRLVTGADFGVKAIYRCLENTEGALVDTPDVPEIVDSASHYVMDSLISAAINGLPVDGWSAEHWHNYMLSGARRTNRPGHVLSHTWSPTHLSYSFSRDGHTYAVKNSCVRDPARHILYPFALSNLIGLTCLRHNVRGEGLRHLVFHDVCNESVLRAIDRTFRAVGREPPSRLCSSPRGPSPHPRPRATPREEIEKHAVRLLIKAPADRDAAGRDAWGQLHADNPFSKAVDHLRGDDTRACENLAHVTHCSVLVVSTASYVERTLIYHLGEVGRIPTHAGQEKGIARG